MVAIGRPRNLDDVRTDLLKECGRSRFAETALYKKPVGKDRAGQQQYIEGLSVRFAEAALRCMKNLQINATDIYDDRDKAVVRVNAVDLENNTTASMDVTITKVVERKFLKKGQKAISERRNSYGDVVFTVEASDDDVLNKKNALLSKARRNLILQLVPGDILEECVERCHEVQEARDQQDPDAAKKRLFDAFGKHGIKPSQLQEYIGHKNQLSPTEIQQVRGIYTAIDGGETTWAEVMGEKEERVLASKKKSESVFEKSGAEK